MHSAASFQVSELGQLTLDPAEAVGIVDPRIPSFESLIEFLARRDLAQDLDRNGSQRASSVAVVPYTVVDHRSRGGHA